MWMLQDGDVRFEAGGGILAGAVEIVSMFQDCGPQRPPRMRPLEIETEKKTFLLRFILPYYDNTII